MSRTKDRQRSLARRLEHLASGLTDTATELDHYGGFDRRMVNQSRRLRAVAVVAGAWARELREDLEAQKAKKTP